LGFKPARGRLWPGRTIHRHRTRRRHAVGGPARAPRPGFLEAVFLLVKVAYALQAFHDQGACHGRLSAAWILVRSDLEPLLCPCGVPSQAAADRQQDVIRLGRLLNDWLPPRPRGWQRQALAILYRVCDAGVAGEDARPAGLAAGLERSAKIARVRWWERVAGSLIVTLWVLPLL